MDLPQVSIAPPALAAGAGGHLFEIEGDPGSADEVPNGGWVLTRTGDGSGALTVDLTVTETVGEMVGDFVPASNEGSRTVTFADGDTTVEYRPIGDDSIKESHGTVTVAIATGTGYEVDADNSNAAVAVRDDDFQMTLTVDPLDLTVVEGEAAQFHAVLSTNNTATFTEADDVGRVMRLRGNTTPGKKAPYPIVWTTFSIEAVRPDDYATLSVSLDVKASDFSADGDGYKARVALTPIQTVDDMEEEEPERFLARLALATESITNLAAVASRANIPDLMQNGEVVELSDAGSIRAVATITDPPSDDATLSRLALTETSSGDGVTLDPVFDPAILQYTAEVPVGVETITLDVVANHADASLTYLDGDESELTDADGETDGFQAALMLGANVLMARVEAEDGTRETYSVSVFRPGPPLSLGIDTVADDGVVNIAEKAGGFSIAGTVQGDQSDAMSDATVTVEIAGETLTATSGSDGTWSVDVPAAAEYVNEPSVTVTVNATKPPNLPAPEVVRTLTVDLTSPTLVSATANHQILDLTYDEDLAISDIPTRAFSVRVGDTVLSSFIAVGIANSSVRLHLHSAVSADDTVTVSYTTPAAATGSKPIRDRADNPVKDLTDHPVANTTSTGEPCEGDEGSMRLLDGSDSREGRVEVCADDDTTDSTTARWGAVCDDYWTNQEADVVCRAVGHERSEPRAGRFLKSTFGSGNGPIWLDDLQCDGDESSLLDCAVANGGLARDAIGVHNCKVSEAVGVRCMAAGDPLKPHVSGQLGLTHPGEDGRYKPGDTLSVKVTFNEPVVVDSTGGEPTISLLLGDQDAASRSAQYYDGSGTKRLEFRYRVTAADGVFAELHVAENSLATNGGRIHNSAGLDAILAHDSAVEPIERFLQRRLSLSDASAQEGAPLQFRVTLNYPAIDEISVSYRAEAGTASAGTDFEATSGTLTFDPGQSEQTVSVVTLDDAHDDSGETVLLTLFEARGATIADGTATGTILNSDPMPQAWLARFGRTAADHAVQAIGTRFRGGESEGSASGTAAEGSAWPGNLATWGYLASTHFQGTDALLSLNGEVNTATMGFDGRRGPWLAGAAVSYSLGKGGYSHESAAGGSLTSNLASLHPYASYRVNDRLSLWGVLGYGVGQLTLRNHGAETAIETALSSRMAAFGGRGLLRRNSSGFELAAVSDALLTHTASDAADGLMSAAGETQRLRMMLEGSGTIELPGGGELRPRIEVGLRYDDGDAENGTGIEVGGDLAYTAGRLSVQVNARTLLAHRDESHEEWGLGGALTWRPDARGYGWSMTGRSSWGAPATGMQSLWNQPVPAGTTGHAPGKAASWHELELGYGLPGLGGRGLWHPFAGTRANEGGGRSVRMGVRLTMGSMLDASFEVGRREQAGSEADHGLQLRGLMRW